MDQMENSPPGKKSKKTRQHAAQSMMWSWKFISRECLITCKTSTVMGTLHTLNPSKKPLKLQTVVKKIW